MLFNSLNFIFVFMTAFLISYFLVENKYKNVVIFLYSVAFYVIGNINVPINILILVAISLLNYLLYILMMKHSALFSKLLLTLIVLFNVGLLVVFKSNIFNIGVPAGFSFYSLGIISLIVDSYKEKKSTENTKYNTISLFEFMSYVLFFPKLLSGPITKFSLFDDDHKKQKINKENIYDGICEFCIGLAYKCFLSANIGYIVNQVKVYGFDSISMPTAWVLAFSYTMELYFDFAGYSYMAIGIARIIGFNFPTNFNVPFAATSMSDFWRRWHMTLGNFYKEYVYIPMGGNRCGKIRQCINLIVVWVLTGLWHGFKLNYMIWAMSICLIILLEKLFINNVYKKCSFIGKIIVIVIIPIVMMVFSLENMSELKVCLAKLFDIHSLSNSLDFAVIMKRYWKIFILGLIFITRFPKVLYLKIKNYKTLMIALCIIMFVVSIYMINVGAHDTFKYFAF